MAECNVILNDPECNRLSIRTKCFGCGNDACKRCTTITRWYRFRRRRICNDCLEERKKDG